MTGNQLAKWLADHKMDQKDGAEFLGVSPSTVHRWITNESRIPHSVTLALAGYRG